MIPALAPIMLIELPSKAIHTAIRLPVPGRLLATPAMGSFTQVVERTLGGTMLTATVEMARYKTTTVPSVRMVALGMVLPAIFVSSAAWANASIPR